MSVRFEGAEARYTNVEVVPAGTELGEDMVREGHVALVFGYDEVFYVEGAPDQVRLLLNKALGALDEIESIQERRPEYDVRHYDAGAMG